MRARASVTVSLVLALLLVLVAGLAPALAQSSQSVRWNRFDVDLAIQRDGSVIVTETQQIAFQGTFRNGFREVPTDRTTGIADVSVSEIDGGQTVPYSRGTGARTYSVSTSNSGVRINWSFPQTTNATRTFVVRYTVRGALRIYDGGDQLQWKAVYADRDGRVDASTVTVHLPAPASADQVRSAYYRFDTQDTIGALPEAGQGTLTDSSTIQFAIGSLPPGVGAEVRTQFPHGAVAASPPAWQAQADQADAIQQSIGPIGNFLSLLLAVALLAGGAIFIFLKWFTGGRDPRPGTVPRVLSEPPSDLPAPLAGTLIDEVADTGDAVATLVDLAERGVLAMEHLPTDAKLTLRQVPSQDKLAPYEVTLLTTIFGYSPEIGQEAWLSQVGPLINARLPVVKAQIYDAMVQERLFDKNPETARSGARSFGIGMVVVGAILGVFALAFLSRFVILSFLPGLVLVILGVIMIQVARHMPRRTALGSVEGARWRAFRRGLMEGKTRPEDAKRNLPYAVAFGVDRTFLNQLEQAGTVRPGLYRARTPDGGIIFLPGWGGPWYGGPVYTGRHGGPSGGEPDVGIPGGVPGGPGVPPPSPQGWSDALADLLNAASRAMASGGGGGGWSGGGFGGGGGGGGGSGGFS